MTDKSWVFDSAADRTDADVRRHFLDEAMRTSAAALLRTYLHAYHRLEIVGRENLPQNESFVLVANHCSHLDAPCLLSALPYRHLQHAYSAAAMDYFYTSRARSLMAHLFCHAVPFARRINARGCLNFCRQLLREPGSVLVLFPEGTRSVTGQLGEFRDGIGFMLAGTKIPVLPCAIRGTFEAWPKGNRLPRPRKIDIAIGVPRRYPAPRTDRQSCHQIVDELQDAVKGLLCR